MASMYFTFTGDILVGLCERVFQITFSVYRCFDVSKRIEMFVHMEMLIATLDGYL